MNTEDVPTMEELEEAAEESYSIDTEELGELIILIRGDNRPQTPKVMTDEDIRCALTTLCVKMAKLYFRVEQLERRSVETNKGGMR